MIHRVERETRIRAAEIRSGCGQPLRSKPLADEKNYPEWFLDHPMLEVHDTECGEHNQTNNREQLIAPLHEGDVAGPRRNCKRKNRLSILTIVARVREYGRASVAHYSRRLGDQS